MRLKVIAALTAAKAVNRARGTGTLSMIAAAKINFYNYYIAYTEDEIALDLTQDNMDARKELIKRVNKLVDSCPSVICNVRESSCATGVYKSVETIINPYSPVGPPVAEPEIEIANLPPTIGDNTITVQKGVTTTLTINMFTTDTILAYSDPEGDLLDAMRIDRLHNTNTGIFYLEGTPVVNGTVITRAQLLAESFTHIGIDQNTFSTDGFEFSIRDEVNMTWVN